MRFILSLILIGLMTLPASAGMVIGSGAAGGGGDTCTQRFSDDFTRANSDTVGNGWTEASGAHSISSNELRTTTGGLLTQSATFTTIKQWAIAKAGSSSPSIEFYFRLDTSDGDPFYGVWCDGSGVGWEYTGGNIQTSASMTCALLDKFAVMVTGTGTNTVVSMWKNPANNNPLSSGASCTDTAKPCWDSAGDAPDLEFTNNPASASDSATGMGLGNWQDGTNLDDFYAGDCSI